VPQQEMELVTIESLVPGDHLLRKIHASIDLDFIRERVRHLYCEDNGRPALDPVVLFKLLLIGYLFGVRSERQLMREVQCNAAYRWYLGLKLTDKVPDASTLSQNRRRRFRDSDVYQKLFDEIVELAIKRGLVTGEVLYSDSTHLKASANKNKFDVVRVEVKPVEYLAQLEQAIEQDRAAEGKRVEGEPECACDQGDQSQSERQRCWLYGARGKTERVLLSGSSYGGQQACHHHRHPCHAGNGA
jgi:transposase